MLIINPPTPGILQVVLNLSTFNIACGSSFSLGPPPTVFRNSFYSQWENTSVFNDDS